VVWAVLLVDREQHLLHRRVARLDDVAGAGREVCREVVGAGDDEREATGARPLSRADALSSTRSPGRGVPTIAV
jgi:hypothetical protein